MTTTLSTEDFKPGDRVRFVSGPIEGKEATVNHVGDRYVFVTSDYGSSTAWLPYRFEKIEPEPTPPIDQLTKAVCGLQARLALDLLKADWPDENDQLHVLSLRSMGAALEAVLRMIEEIDG